MALPMAAPLAVSLIPRTSLVGGGVTAARVACSAAVPAATATAAAVSAAANLPGEGGGRRALRSS
eukprot:336489-Pyramimonas_sp.AAC.1